jgi:hypothetical protein
MEIRNGYIRKYIHLVFKGEELGQFERVGWFSDEREALENSHGAIFERHWVEAENKKQIQNKILRLIMTREKILRGCEWSKLNLPQHCVDEIHYAHLLQFSHKAGVKKYTSANGKIVHPSDLASRGVSIATLLSEIDKCDILCANCHTYYTHEIERK